MSFTACLISAVRSMNAGPFPVPPYINGFPDSYAKFNIPGTPVFIISEVSLWFINSTDPLLVTV